MKKIPQAFSFEENWQNILSLEKLLCQRGLEIHPGSPLEQASLGSYELLEISKNKAIHNERIDCRENWRRALSLADLARKILKAASRPDFEALMPHIKLLLEPANLSQFSFSPKEDGITNKIFELFVAVVLFQVCSDLRFDDPNSSSKTKRPDVIGDFRKKKWGFECKTLHSPNPKTFLERVTDGIDQIEAVQDVDRGIVIINFKNLISHDDMWPARFDPQTGKWGYLSLTNQGRDYPVAQMQENVEGFEQEIFTARGGYQAFLDLFIGKKTIPMVFIFSCTVANIEKAPNVRGPMIVKKMSKIGMPFQNLDSEAFELLNLFNDHLYDRME